MIAAPPTTGRASSNVTLYRRRASTVEAQTATRTANQQRADDRIDRLTARLNDAEHTVTDRQAVVDGLETQPATWMINYERTVPTRYLGLAAAAEQARRAFRGNRRDHHLRHAEHPRPPRRALADLARPRPGRLRHRHDRP